MSDIYSDTVPSMTSTNATTVGLSESDLGTVPSISDLLSEQQTKNTLLSDSSGVDQDKIHNDMPWISSVLSLKIDRIEYQMGSGWESFEGNIRSAITSLVKHYLEKSPDQDLDKCGRLHVALGGSDPGTIVKVNVLGLETIGVYFDLPSKSPRSGDLSMHITSPRTAHAEIIKQIGKHPTYSMKDILASALNARKCHVRNIVSGEGQEEVWAMYYKPAECEWQQIVVRMTRDAFTKYTF